jgi:aldose 1-epimerase
MNQPSISKIPKPAIPTLEPVIGRIANRIKNSSFNLDGTEYNISKSHDGVYTLHGGIVGYDQRNWTVTAYTSSSVTFALSDDAAEGFPGDTVTHATYTVDSKRTADNPQGSPRLVTELASLALTESTPIVLSNHIYWNLNAFKQTTILDDVWLQLPLSRRFIETDSNQIPTGVITTVEDSNHNSMDFTASKTIGQDISYTEGLSGTGCIGYNHFFIIDCDPLYAPADDNLVPALRWHSSTTGSAWRLRPISPQYRSLRV